jgi:ribosomal protein L21E
MQFKIGDKVKIVKNCNRHLPLPPGTMGKEGKVAGAVTGNSCRVKIAYGDELWFEFRELEMVKAGTEKVEAKKTTTRRRKK